MYNVDQTDEHLNRQNQILAHVPCLKLNAYTHTRTFFVLIEPMCFYYYHCLPFECEGTMIVVEEESERRAHHYCRQPLMRARSPEPQRQEWKSSTINVIYKKKSFDSFTCAMFDGVPTTHPSTIAKRSSTNDDDSCDDRSIFID